MGESASAFAGWVVAGELVAFVDVGYVVVPFTAKAFRGNVALCTTGVGRVRHGWGDNAADGRGLLMALQAGG